MPTTSAIGGITHGSSVTIVIRPRNCGMYSSTAIDSGSSSARLTITASMASWRLIHAAWCSPGSPRASVSPFSDQPSNRRSGVSSAVGMRWNANRAIVSIGSAKYRLTTPISR